MEAFTADLCLTFKSGEDELGELLVVLIGTIDQNTFDKLSEQILVMKWNVRSSIL